ncbi:hypothetical protein [Fructilactobacillus cliffordii]|uniref:Uncharacterized protein n=1 Tax=Fructilactobacillus cliffordii TaxID=2940299 RepID=A0A9Q8ZUQ8_9LACO|nr:hypothetical protein [Fructilactobacillus cliffordii]USS89969.1 hypothetical protein M3M40_07215 [Fructilactobacillus cliffordii]
MMKVLKFGIHSRFENGSIIIDAVIKKENGDVINCSVDENNSPNTTREILNCIFKEYFSNILESSVSSNSIDKSELGKSNDQNKGGKENSGNSLGSKVQEININPGKIINEVKDDGKTNGDPYDGIKLPESLDKVEAPGDEITPADFITKNVTGSENESGSDSDGAVEVNPNDGLIHDSDGSDDIDNFGDEDEY